jgi:exonuclease SbcC
MGAVDDALEKARAALEESRALLVKAEEDEDTARTTWVRDRQDAETKRQSLRDQYVDRQKQRESVESEGPEGECPVCKRPLGSVYQEVLNTLDRQREEIEVQGKFFRRRVEQLETVPSELRAAEDRLRSQRAATEAALQEVARCEDRVREREQALQELERLASRRAELAKRIEDLPDAYDSDRHDQVRQRLRELEPTITRQAELRARAARAETLVSEAEAAERVASEREASFRDLESALERLGYSEDAYNQAREQYQVAELQVREVELRRATVRGDQKAAAAALAAVQQRIREREERERRIASTRGEVHLHDELDRALRDLRQELNASMRPELAERASDFLADLSDGRYSELELDEEYRFLLIEEGRAKPVISGGEEDILHLVLRLGISQMVAERAGQPLSLLVLDEVFGSLDEQRRRGVVSLLRGLADRFPQVVLITHIDSVRDTVDRVLRVNLDTGRSMAVVTEEDPMLGDAGVAA